MTTQNKISLLLTFAAILLIISCEREWNNPWDEFNNLSPDAWAPQNLQIEDVSITEKKLTWTYDGDQRIEGFKIDRKKGDEAWQMAYQSFPKETRNWSDTEIIPDPPLTYEYRLYAFAGKNLSGQITKSFYAQITAPSNLQITPNSITSVTLTWQDNGNGEEGFKIDRKYEGRDWQRLTTTNDNHYVDIDFELNIQVYYRVSAFVGQYNSSFAENGFHSQIPAPTNLNITLNSISSVTISWQDYSNGEEGFKIDRRLNSGTWEVDYAIVSSNQASFSDNNLDWQFLSDVYYYRVYAFVGQYKSNEIENSVSVCGFPFTDSRDNHSYETAQIGTQCWMKENLAYLPSVSPSSNGSQTSLYYYVYGYQGTSVTAAKATANYQTYGVLYNWPASLTACPDGWHLPTDAEWTTLTTYLGGESVAGGKMKETGTTHWQSPNTGATDSSGFTALPGGYLSTNGTFASLGNYGYFWSSFETSYAWYRTMNYNSTVVFRNNYDKGYGFSVRCLRD